MNVDRNYSVNILRLRTENSQYSCSVLFIFPKAPLNILLYIHTNITTIYKIPQFNKYNLFALTSIPRF